MVVGVVVVVAIVVVVVVGVVVAVAIAVVVLGVHPLCQHAQGLVLAAVRNHGHNHRCRQTYSPSPSHLTA